jgi:hypothetical protein
MMESPAITRLIRLLDAGYVVNVSYSVAMADVLELEHPAGRKRVAEPSLFLRPDGEIYGGPGAGETLVIKPNDSMGFDDLVRRTPKPTWWEKNRRPFDVVFAWAIIAGVSLVMYAVMSYVLDVIKG